MVSTVCIEAADAVAVEVPTMDDCQLFRVHVWAASPGFRASARRVDSDEPRLLNTPQELADYFAAVAAAGAQPAAPSTHSIAAGASP